MKRFQPNRITFWNGYINAQLYRSSFRWEDNVNRRKNIKEKAKYERGRLAGPRT